MADGDGPAPEGPPVDGRDRAAIRAAVRSRAPHYTGEAWDPDAGGPGATLVELFADLTAGVTERLDQVPAKHRRAFVDALGFERQPPQSASLPLTVEVSAGAGGNVAVPGGTRAIGEDATGSEVFFEVDEGFEATPATLDRVVAVDPATDHVRSHDLSPGGAGDATLFGGESDQTHALYLGDAETLAVDPTSDAAGAPVLELEVETNASLAALGALEWQYYGNAGPDTPATWRTLRGRGEVSGEGTDQTLEVAAVADLLEAHGYELALDAYGCDAGTDDVARDCAALVEQWLLTGVLARGLDRPAGTPPPYVDVSRDAGLVDLYAALAGLAREQLDPPAAVERTDTRRVTLAFDLPGEVTEYEAFGVESRWVRARIPEAAPVPLTERLLSLRLADVRLATGRLSPSGDGPEPVAADALLANDVPLEVPPAEPGGGDAAVRPFGTRPGRLDAFYVASEEAFTKAGQRVTVEATLDPPGEGGDASPAVSWEYWNGSGWDRLPLADPSVGDGTPANATADAQFREETSTVRFTVPPDLSPTEVAGHEGHWIRVRLVGGNYGTVPYDNPVDTEQIWQRIDKVAEPVVTALGLTYESPDGGLSFAAPTRVKRENNLAVADVDPAGRFHPFEGVPTGDQALYLGFDGPLRGGPLSTYLSLADFRYPPEFAPRVRWESWQGDGWEPVSVRDGTEGLRETGVVRFSPPAATASRREFGADRHWLRASVTAPGGFVPEPYRRLPGRERDARGGGGDATGEAGGERVRGRCGRCGGVSRLCGCERPTARCGDRLPTTPPVGGTPMALPRAELLASNTAVASNVRTRDGEILGSADGTADQTFVVGSPPVRDPAVWVDELETLSAGEREALAADQGVDVEAVGPEGDPSAFWVRWERVADFRSSGPGDRHYAVEAVTGTVTFGDGERGAVPPRGRDNVRASYETGGGANGNVPAGAVTDLEGTLAFVESVTNNVPGGGGADAESTGAVLERAPRELRDRNRAVAPVDFERLARASARKLARARCLPQLDPRGEVRPGWVTVLVVPRSAERKPVPSPSLKARVTHGLAAHAPAALLGEEGEERLVVRAPSYVEATVEATVAAGRIDSQSELEAAAEAAVSSYLHPLAGGDDGTGWPFGDLPCVSDCLAVLERVEGVDHVADLRLRFRANGTERTVRPGEQEPDVAADVLVYSGTHRIDAVGGT
ncbi:MAG: putative baseplate assembly protein [Haloferacaceae archaeon]